MRHVRHVGDLGVGAGEGEVMNADDHRRRDADYARWVALIEKHYGRVSAVRRAAHEFAYYEGYRDGLRRARTDAEREPERVGT